MSEGIEIEGLDKLIKKLDALPDKVVKKVARPAITKAGRIVRKQMKANAPVGCGVLKRSFTAKTKTYQSGNVVSVVGANTKTVGTVTLESGRTIKEVPANYLHLVEFGTSHSAPNPFMRRAYEQTKNEVTKKIQDEMSAGIEKQAEKK